MGKCWMVVMEDDSFNSQFLNSLYIVLDNILASGYGLFIPVGDAHIVWNSLLMIFGRLFICYILGKAYLSKIIF